MSNILRAMSDGTSYNIIVKSYLSYDGGVPIGGHAKVASQTEDRIAHATYIYTMYTYINISSFLILSMYVRCSSLISSSLMAFFSRFVSVTLAILRGSWSMATTAAVFTEKLRLTLRTRGLCFLYIPRWSHILQVIRLLIQN